MSHFVCFKILSQLILLKAAACSYPEPSTDSRFSAVFEAASTLLVLDVLGSSPKGFLDGAVVMLLFSLHLTDQPGPGKRQFDNLVL